MKIGDYVVRKKYNKDIIFEIFDIQGDIYYLRGVELRLIADSDIDDLELLAKKFNKNIMDSVFAKTKDSKVASEILEVLEYKNFENDSEAISYIESVSIEDVVKQFLDIMSDYGLYIMNKVGDDDESRRIRL